jgi:hypothetical protein
VHVARRKIVLGVVVLLALGSGSARGYEADLVPTRKAVAPDDFAGVLTIFDSDGQVRVEVEGVNNLRGEPVDGRASLHLRLRVNGVRRKVVLGIPLEGGDGEASMSLGLGGDDRVAVQQVRLRAPDHRIIAEAGMMTSSATSEPPPEPPAPPTADQCPAELETCQEDFADCLQDLDDCEEGL